MHHHHSQLFITCVVVLDAVLIQLPSIDFSITVGVCSFDQILEALLDMGLAQWLIFELLLQPFLKLIPVEHTTVIFVPLVEDHLHVAGAEVMALIVD